MSPPTKRLIRSLCISIGGYFVMPEGSNLIWIILANEFLKMYRMWKETREMEEKFEAQRKEWEAHMKKMGVNIEN